MKNIFYTIVLFIMTSVIYAQQPQWSAEEKAKVTEEVAEINKLIELTDNQTEALMNLFLEKNKFLNNADLSLSRRNWTVEHSFLEEIKVILNSSNQSKNSTIASNNRSANRTTQLISKNNVNDILSNEKLLKLLNLHIIPLETNSNSN